MRSNDTSSFIQQKLDEHDKKLNDMKDNIDMLNEVTTSNSMTIQLQDAQITHLMTSCYPPFLRTRLTTPWLTTRMKNSC